MVSLVEVKDFLKIRKILGKSQKELADIIGISIRTIESYEQGWRNIPPHAERQVLFLLFNRKEKKRSKKPCWKITKCPSKRKKSCPAWEFNSGNLCWFINGTICEGKPLKSWSKKMEVCRECKVMKSFLDDA